MTVLGTLEELPLEYRQALTELNLSSSKATAPIPWSKEKGCRWRAAANPMPQYFA